MTPKFSGSRSVASRNSLLRFLAPFVATWGGDRGWSRSTRHDGGFIEDETPEIATANFREFLFFPRTSVNKGIKKDQNPDEVIPWPFFLEERLAAYPDGCSMTPSCCIMPSRSALVQCSTILPPSMRFVLTLLTSTFLPVAGMPQSSP